jgi:uncharacterized protein YecA (UPF0149 family)
MTEMLYVFVDANNNEHVFAGRSKSDAIEKRKRYLPGVKCEFQGTRFRKQVRPVPISSSPPKSKIDPVRNTEAEIGRNDPCPCNSGRKYKHCCIRKR